MQNAVIVNAVRTPVGKAHRGVFKDTRPDDLAALAIEGVLSKVPQVAREDIEDVILGCAMPEAEQGSNVARIASLRAGLPVSCSAMTVNRFCASGLQAIALAADRIRAGSADMILAGGTESMSMIPMGGNKRANNPWLEENHPETYLPMGLTAERVAKRFSITREESDAFAYESHRRALNAIGRNAFADEIVGVPASSNSVVLKDEGPRRDTSPEALAQLEPVFDPQGIVTAGNSSQMSDGAAAVLVMSERRAEALGLRPLARFVSYAYAGCDPEVMGIGPIFAVPKALTLAGLSLSQIDLIELNEAFAAQALAVIRSLELPRETVNVNGGAIALGHPLGCTGAKLTATLLHEMQRRGSRYGMVTMCVGGGMGAAGIFESIQ